VNQDIRDRAAGENPNIASNGKAANQARTFAVNTNDWLSLVPITDKTALYKGEDGGLYGS
jgi:hypothetical protein